MLLPEGEDMGLRRAGCGESRMPGSGGGVGKHRLAVRPAPTSHQPRDERLAKFAVERNRPASHTFLHRRSSDLHTVSELVSVPNILDL
jgi:hypothetical protein